MAGSAALEVYPVEVIGIAAVARNGVIGSGNDIPWRIPEDWRRFSRLTGGNVLIMGRKTYDSIGRPLPGRTTLVVTRNPRWYVEGVRAVGSVDEAFAQAALLATDRVYVAGGGEIYRAAWPRLRALEITEVDAEPAGKVIFPVLDRNEWRQVARQEHDGYAFVSYRRVEPGER